MRRVKDPIQMGYEHLGGSLYRVKSFSNVDSVYNVDIEKDTCDCIAWGMGRKRPCKHLIYVHNSINADKKN